MGGEGVLGQRPWEGGSTDSMVKEERITPAYSGSPVS
jgi:hypothetical protein